MAMRHDGGIAVISAAQHAHDRRAGAHHALKHGFIAPPDPLIGQREKAEAVVAVHINARIVEDEIGTHGREQIVDVGNDRAQIGLVLQPPRETAVQIA